MAPYGWEKAEKRDSGDPLEENGHHPERTWKAMDQKREVS